MLDRLKNKIILCDYKNILKKLPDNSVDLIIIDPPYSKKFNIDYDFIGKHSNRILKSGGSLIILCGHYQILDISNYLIKYLRYWWLGALVGNRSNRMFGKNVIIKFKPILWFLKGKRKNTKYVPIDCIIVDKSKWDKKYHKWQQPKDFFENWIFGLTEKNDIVLDFFIGSGTTAVVCQDLERNFIGSDNNKKSCFIAIKRLNIKNVIKFK